VKREIPLLRDSAVLAKRLHGAAGRWAEHRHRFHRRVNWSWRYSSEFHHREEQLFTAQPDEYLAGRVNEEPALEDVFAKRLPWRNIASALLKVMSHTLFVVVGRVFLARPRPDGWKYRKCYVDDIELVFDEGEDGVLRAVYPFPISLPRQVRYLRYLMMRQHPFVLDGNRYVARDVVRLLRRRDVASLLRLEARGELRRAIQLVKDAPSLVQLSDEFNIGSLEFARYLARARVPTVNVAHGVGKYFPVHAYQRFDVLTERQRAYYSAAVPCVYGHHTLAAGFGVSANSAKTGPRGAVVILGQDFGDPTSLIAQAEGRMVGAVIEATRALPDKKLFYKPHPNNRNPQAPPGFDLLEAIDAVSALPDPVLLSLFSTTHLDPRFEGRKYLVRTGLIRPEIAFDDDGRIVDVDQVHIILQAES
jgi:hypothetical protein